MSKPKYKKKVITCFLETEEQGTEIARLLEQADKLMEHKLRRPVFRTEVITEALKELIESLEKEPE